MGAGSGSLPAAGAGSPVPAGRATAARATAGSAHAKNDSSMSAQADRAAVARAVVAGVHVFGLTAEPASRDPRPSPAPEDGTAARGAPVRRRGRAERRQARRPSLFRGRAAMPRAEAPAPAPAPPSAGGAVGRRARHE